jgi:hypothetical protein
MDRDCGHRLSDKGQGNLTLREGDLGNFDTDPVPETDPPPRSRTVEGLRPRIPTPQSRQILDADQPLHREGIEFGEEAEARHRQHRRIAGFVEVALHEFGLLQVDHGPLGFHRLSFPSRALLTRRGKFLDRFPCRLGSTFEERDDLTMDEQVRIATDRRREVTIELEGEAEMPHIVGRVASLLERTQDLLREYLLEAMPAQRRERLCDVGGAYLRPGGYMDSGRMEKAIEVLDVGRIGGLVDAVGQGQIRAGQFLGDSPVRLEHELLDETMRIVSFADTQCPSVALLVEFHPDLREIEIERPRAQAPPMEDRHQLTHRCEHLPQPAPRRLRPARLSLEERGHLRVRQPGLAPENGAIEALGASDSGRVVLHLRNEDESVPIGVERTELVGEALGQHRYGPVGEIDTRTPGRCLGIEGRSRQDVV